MQGVSFPDFTAFSADTFCKPGAFLCSSRSYGQAVLGSHLYQLVYSTSLHNILDGILSPTNAIFYDSAPSPLIPIENKIVQNAS